MKIKLAGWYIFEGQTKKHPAREKKNSRWFKKSLAYILASNMDLRIDYFVPFELRVAVVCHKDTFLIEITTTSSNVPQGGSVISKTIEIRYSTNVWFD